MRVLRMRLERIDRGDVDDAPAYAVARRDRLHMANGGDHHVIGSLDIDRHRRVPVRVGQLKDRFARVNGRAIDQRVDAPKLVCDGPKCGEGVVLVPDIALSRVAGPSRRKRRRKRGGGRIGVQINHRQTRRAPFHRHIGQQPAKARSGADDRNIQSVHCVTPFCV